MLWGGFWAFGYEIGMEERIVCLLLFESRNLRGRLPLYILNL